MGDMGRELCKSSGAPWTLKEGEAEVKNSGWTCASLGLQLPKSDCLRQNTIFGADTPLQGRRQEAQDGKVFHLKFKCLYGFICKCMWSRGGMIFLLLLSREGSITLYTGINQGN